MRRWQEHLTSDMIIRAYRDRGDVNRVTADMRWNDDNEAVKHIFLNSIPEDISGELLIDLGRRMQNTMCGEDDDVRIHFAKLANMPKEL